jgi:hypothetical protein
MLVKKETEMKMIRVMPWLALPLLLAAACAPVATPQAQPASAPAAQPVAAVAVAPICQTGGSCTAPTAEQHEIDCVNKMPYTNVLVEAGTAFEVLDKSGDFTCNDSGMVVDGKRVISCFGKELYRFDLKLTNTTCSGAGLQTGTGQCQEGYGFDAAQNCCAPVGGDTPGSTVVSVELGACPLPQILAPN